MIVLEIVGIIFGILIFVPGVLFWVYSFRDRKKILARTRALIKNPEQKVQSVEVYKKYDPKTNTFVYDIRHEK